jgi:hypothetical protein
MPCLPRIRRQNGAASADLLIGLNDPSGSSRTVEWQFQRPRSDAPNFTFAYDASNRRLTPARFGR